NFQYGDEVTLSCHDGFKASGGDTRLTCVGQNKWQGDPLTCDLRCEKVKPGNYSKIVNENENFTHFECFSGFEPAGGSSVINCHNGVWSNTSLRCKLACDPPVIPNNSQIYFDESRPGIAYYSCNDNFRLVKGDAIRACNSNGSWSGQTPECELITCTYNASIPNGELSTNILNIGESLNVTCRVGYQRNASILTCDNAGRLVGAAPQCNPITCGHPPFLANATWDGNLLFGDRVTYTCEEGFTMVNIALDYIQCDASGTWDGSLSECKEIMCDEIDPIPHVVMSGSNQIGKSIFLSCERDFDLDGPRLECGVDGRWAGSLTECQTDDGCTEIEVINANKEGGSLTGQSTTFTCHDGYALAEGDAVLTCFYDGRWEGVIPVCEAGRCPPVPKIPNAIPNTSLVDSNTTVAYDCVRGFRSLNESSSAFCRE
ncbi:hypothetical protein CAPTEDRAFT_72629, partial [Capitella teleta]